jgi:hypothetical protein
VFLLQQAIIAKKNKNKQLRAGFDLQSKSSIKLFVTGEAAQNYCLVAM